MQFSFWFLEGIFHSRCIWLRGGKPLQALSVFSKQALCWNKELITGELFGVCGALNKNDKTEWIQAICLNESIVSSLRVTLVNNSIKIIISIINGAANNESSHVLWIEIIFSPPQKIEESY